MTESGHQKCSPLWAGLLLISSLAPPFAGAAEKSGAMSVQFDDGLVSVSANSVPVRYVIEAIADQAGLRLVEHVELDRNVTLDIDRQPLPAAIELLLENDSYTLYQAMPGIGDDADHIPGTLWVFPKGTSPALAAIAGAAHNSDPRVRGEAAAALASGDGETSAQYLVMAFDDSDPRVRMAVIESLADVPFGTVPGELAVATLRRALEDEDPEVRMSAVDAMEEIGGGVVYQTLMQSQADRGSEMPDAIRESLFAPEK